MSEGRFPLIKGGQWPLLLTEAVALINSIWGAGDRRDWETNQAYWLSLIYDTIMDVAVLDATILAHLQDPETGLTSICQRIATVEGKIDTLLARPAGTTEAPSTSITQNLNDVGDAVWSYELPDGESARDHLRWAGTNGWWKLGSGYVFPGAPGFKVKFYDIPPPGWYALGLPPKPNWADIQATDTRLSWLQRADPTRAWHQTVNEVTPTATWHTYDKSLIYLDLTEGEFNLLKSLGAAGLQFPTRGYPGLAKVTLGTPVEFEEHEKVDAVTYGVAGKMDGVLLELTSIPSTVGHQQIEDVWRYFRIGWAVFSDASANTDVVQFLGPHLAALVPVGFSAPANVVISCKPGVSGIITPWVVKA